MAIDAKFYLTDVVEEIGLNGDKRIVKDVLFFKMTRPCIAGAHLPATEFEGKATEQHAKSYESKFLEFKSVNPSYLAPWEPKPEEVVVTEVAAPVLELPPVDSELPPAA